MDACHRRPFSIWIALIILAGYVPLLVGAFFLVPVDESVLEAPELADLIIDHVEASAVILSVVVAFWAVASRRKWGRWFVIATLAYIIGQLAYGQTFDSERDPNVQEDILLGAIVFLSPLLLAVVLVYFGEDSKNYFSGESLNENEQGAR